MQKGRLEAFSDGVIAVIITIMVLEIHVPEGADLHALFTVLPTIAVYLLSFVFVGIYWNNHHHMLTTVKRVNGRMLWANHHLLFWLSLVPFGTAWLARDPFTPIPTAFYGMLLLGSALAFTILQNAIIAYDGETSLLRQAVGANRKSTISLVCYSLGIICAFITPVVSYALFVFVAVIWFAPDPRIERAVANKELNPPELRSDVTSV